MFPQSKVSLKRDWPTYTKSQRTQIIDIAVIAGVVMLLAVGNLVYSVGPSGLLLAALGGVYLYKRTTRLIFGPQEPSVEKAPAPQKKRWFGLR